MKRVGGEVAALTRNWSQYDGAPAITGIVRRSLPRPNHNSPPQEAGDRGDGRCGLRVLFVRLERTGGEETETQT